MIPDCEKIVSDYLRDSLGKRVVGKPPSSTVDAWIQVTQLAAIQNDPADHLVEFYLQFDCYAGATGGQPEANLLARTVREFLIALNGTQADAVISVVRIAGDVRLPDTSFDPARDRRILSAHAWAHTV